MKAKIVLLNIVLACCLLKAGLARAAAPTATPSCGVSVPSWTGTDVQELLAINYSAQSGMALCCSNLALNGANTGASLSLTFSTSTSDDFKFQVQLDTRTSNHYKINVKIDSQASFAPDCNVTDTWYSDYSGGDNFVWNYITSQNLTNTNAFARTWTLAPGLHTITFVTQQSDISIEKVDIWEKNPPPTPTYTVPPTPVPLGNGLCGTYYNNMNLSAPAKLSRTDTQVNFNWGNGSPDPSLPVDGFSAQWSGQIELPSSGTYIFSTVSDDGVTLSIDGVQMINDWSSHSSTTDASAPTTMAMGKHTILMQYFENTGSAVAQLLWAGPTGVSYTAAVPQGRLYSSGCVAPTPTRTPTIAIIPPTPTFTVTPVIPVWQGLESSERLYGMEYIPFPENKTGSTYFYDLAMTFTAAANNVQPKNTARWKIQFVNLASSVGNQIAVETRIGPYGVSCTTGYYNANNYTSSLSLPPRPANFSSSYFWVDGSGPGVVPATEQHDTMGDPRYVPYVDMMSVAWGDSSSTGVPFANYYNWFFKNLGDSTQVDNRTLYATFAPMAKYDHYAGNSNSDVPMQFAYWRLGVLRDASVYTSMTGWDSYYIGIGGEIGGDSANELGNAAPLSVGQGVPMSNAPWGSSGISGRNEITAASSLVRNTASTWRSMPFIGELWPDSAYATDWSSSSLSPAPSGNLRNSQSSGSWRRDAWENCDVSTSPANGTNFVFKQVQHINGPPGCASFLDGNGGGSTTNTFNHYGEDNTTANLLSDGKALSQAYNYPMPATFNISRPWGLNANGNSPQEWGQGPYANIVSLGIYSASTQSASTIGFYSRETDKITDNLTQRASAAVRAEDTLNHIAGWFVINGLAPSTQSGINFVAQFAILSCLRTFHDAGAPTKSAIPQVSWTNLKNQIGSNTYRIEPVPLVTILHPNNTTDVTQGLSSIPVEWNERYARWDNQRYTENYPCLDSYGDTSTVGPCSPHNAATPDDPTYEWHSSTPLEYMLKFSSDNGVTWYTVTTPTVQCQVGYEYNPPSMAALPPGEILQVPATQHDFTWNWDVTSLPVGNKLFRVECYRSNINQHYAYHQVSIFTSP